MREKITKDWKQGIKPYDFLECLLTERNGPTWLNICCSWSDSFNERKECFEIASALVRKETSQSLLNALSTCLNPHDFKLPSYREQDMEYSNSPFDLQGWIWRSSKNEGLDTNDPQAVNLDYPPYRIGNSIIEQLGLSVDLEQRKWFIQGQSQESLTCGLWNSSDREDREEVRRYGIRMSASLEFLKILCSTLDLDLIVEVQIQRHFCRSSSYTRSNDDGEYSTPNRKIYILSADGKLRDTGTCYQLR